MPALANQRHEKFAQHLAQGKSATEAYAEAGYEPSQPNSSRLTLNEMVQKRVAELKERAAVSVSISREWVIEKLVENVERAMQAQAVLDREGEPTGEYKYEGNVANRALELLGKELGMFVERAEIGRPGDFERMSTNELERMLVAGLAARRIEHREDSGRALEARALEGVSH